MHEYLSGDFGYATNGNLCERTSNYHRKSVNEVAVAVAVQRRVLVAWASSSGESASPVIRKDPRACRTGKRVLRAEG